MEKTKMEQWIHSKISEDSYGPITRDMIEEYQLKKLHETIEWVKKKSRFYKNVFADIDVEYIKNLKDIEKLPFTSPSDIKEKGRQFICVSQDEIHRIVTLTTSGTTNEPKRIYFTKEDQELTIDFFHHGMKNLVVPKDRVLILMPGERPGSVGDLLQKGLEQLGACGIVYGPIDDLEKVWHILYKESINSIVGIPKQVLALARYGNLTKKEKFIKIKSVLLSADYVPNAIVDELKELWNCKVFEHYGMTEMGLGGGVYCEAFKGYHLREADLYFEIIDPYTGEVLEDGKYGEVVFTTLTRKGMPLIRYRTGDMSRFIPEPCPCGTILKRLDKVLYRIKNVIRLSNEKMLTISELDEILFSIKGILDYDVIISRVDNKDYLTVFVQLLPQIGEEIYYIIYKRLTMHPTITDLIRERKLVVKIRKMQQIQKICNGMQKRSILDNRSNI